LAAAERILAEQGDSKRLSIRAVADGAGVTPPSVYRHFHDKADLLRSVVEARFDAFGAALDRAAAGARDPFDELRKRCGAYLAFAADDPASYGLLFSATQLGPGELGTEGRDWHPGVASFFRLADNVQRCLDAGAAEQSADAMLLAMLVWTHLHGCADLRLSKPEMPWPPGEELTDRALELFGLAAPPKTRSARARSAGADTRSA
jgi:AcrR family transcriptional regulator